MWCQWCPRTSQEPLHVTKLCQLLILTSATLEKHTDTFRLLIKPFYIQFFSHKTQSCGCWLHEEGLSSGSHWTNLIGYNCHDCLVDSQWPLVLTWLRKDMTQPHCERLLEVRAVPVRKLNRRRWGYFCCVASNLTKTSIPSNMCKKKKKCFQREQVWIRSFYICQWVARS